MINLKNYTIDQDKFVTDSDTPSNDSSITTLQRRSYSADSRRLTSSNSNTSTTTSTPVSTSTTFLSNNSSFSPSLEVVGVKNLLSREICNCPTFSRTSTPEKGRNVKICRTLNMSKNCCSTAKESTSQNFNRNLRSRQILKELEHQVSRKYLIHD